MSEITEPSLPEDGELDVQEPASIGVFRQQFIEVRIKVKGWFRIDGSELTNEEVRRWLARIAGGVGLAILLGRLVLGGQPAEPATDPVPPTTVVTVTSETTTTPPTTTPASNGPIVLSGLFIGQVGWTSAAEAHLSEALVQIGTDLNGPEVDLIAAFPTNGMPTIEADALAAGRIEAVRQWLVHHDVPADRIAVPGAAPANLPTDPRTSIEVHIVS